MVIWLLWLYVLISYDAVMSYSFTNNDNKFFSKEIKFPVKPHQNQTKTR